MKRTSLAILVVAALAAGARAELRGLVEQELLPALEELPTCACVIQRDLDESDLLVVGLAGGDIVVFVRTGGRSVQSQRTRLGGVGPVESATCVRFQGGAGPGTKHAILAVQGAVVSAVSYEARSVMGSRRLPPPDGTYRLVGLGPARALAFDDDSVLMLALGSSGGRWDIGVEELPIAPGRLSVTECGGVVTLMAGAKLYRVTDRGVQELGQLPADVLDAGGPLVCTEHMVAAPDTDNPASLLVLARASAGSWKSTVVPLPGPLTMLTAVSDTTVLAGGVRPDTLAGWVALVDAAGRRVAVGGHAQPPVSACVMDGYFVVHGGDHNLSILRPDLSSVWDHDSRFVSPVALLPMDYDGDRSDDVALVGVRTVLAAKAETDSLRKYLKRPDLMAGARLVNGRYQREEALATVFLSRRAELARTTSDLERSAVEALAKGGDASAIELLSESRAAAAAVGDRERVAGLTKTLGDWTTRGGRGRATAVLALVLAAAGLFYALGCARGAIRLGVTVACAVALCAVAVLGWRLFGRLAWTPLLAVGGVAPLATVAWRVARSGTQSRPHPGAPIDELREALTAFIHAVDDDLRSVGRTVSDAPRKTVTALAALAEDMRRSLDNPEQYQALLERVKVRGESFGKIVVPHLEHIVWLAGRARFLVPEAKTMHAAGQRIAAALDVLLGAAAADRSLLDAELRAIPDARRELVAAAERAWDELKANPGCSLMAVFEYVAGEKKDEMKSAAVSLATTVSLRPGQDAVRIAHHELYGILENLFTNALRAVDAARAREIRIDVRSVDDACHVRFADTGVGMSQSQAAGLFAQTRGDVREGGTGLPQAKRVLSRYGGDITVEKTEVGAGTTFLLVIPHWSPTIIPREPERVN